MRYFLVLLIWCILSPKIHTIAQQTTRIESEFKLAIPDSLVNEVECYLSQFMNSDYTKLMHDSLSVDNATEIFRDSYFDTKSEQLLKQQIGLRHRLRFLDKELMNELVQLKLPDSKDGITRQEIKFEVSGKINQLDELSRNPVLKYIAPAERDFLRFTLHKFGVYIKDLREIVALTQKRERIYFSDEKGSVATITLDKVSHNKFPFQKFTELEIEINEQRYTESDLAEKIYLENISKGLKFKVKKKFPQLIIDQTPKYNKLMALINADVFSRLPNALTWTIYIIILLFACIKLVLV